MKIKKGLKIHEFLCFSTDNNVIISSTGQSPGRAIVLPPASALELVLAWASALAKC